MKTNEANTVQRVLVVEDDPRTLELLKQTIERNFRCAVDTAKNAYEAVERLKGSERYALVVSDNSMPLPNDGIDLLYWMRLVSESREKTPFVLHTGDDQEHTKAKVAKMGGVYHYKHARTPLKDTLSPFLA